jgi:predicted DNA-binding transcriptional regulator YafY
MHKIDRLVGIVLLLQSKRVIRAEDIAEHFAISVRTVYRDIAALCEAGVPIAGEAGVGYSLIAGYSLPPVMFTEEEASALVIGGEFVRRMTDESLHKHIRSAMMKIHAVLPAEKKNYVQRLQDSVAVFTRPAGIQSELAEETMSTLQRAIVYRRVVRMDYAARDGETTNRAIEPLNLIYYSGNWHCIAYCRLRKEYRDFRADRIQSAFATSEVFVVKEEYSLMEYLQEAYRLENPVEVKARFQTRVTQGLSQKYYYGFVEEYVEGEHTVMSFIVPSIRWIGWWLMGFGSSVKALSPPELLDFMRTEAEAVAAQYHSHQILSDSTTSLN